ncbi:unnamed protein product [Euphydryas editha]|uniref:Spaetzle domain-containing protein n=1 Tax=Euphydryas editha TaxID=104508 RepID=A0AAU9UGT9_EUPED|nr:unnamed protein product [Euphydryas editha]
MLSPVVSEECRKRGICTTVENYPTELAKRLIQELKDKDAKFPSDAEQDMILNDDKPQVCSRLGPNPTLPLCNSIRRIEVITAAVSRNKTWNYILNDVDKPIQTVAVERCVSEGSRCSNNIQFMANYECVCVQRWSLKKMYYIDENENLVKDFFKVPTCCSCKLHPINK